MKTYLKPFSLCLMTLSFFYSNNIWAQYSQYKAIHDTTSYPYFFPILGAKSVEEGFDIPLPTGIMVNYFWADQGVTIDNIGVGFDFPELEVPVTDISDLIQFGDVSGTVNTITVRPDIWVFPFLNVYGLAGKTYVSTHIELVSPVHFETNADFVGNSFGAGTSGAFGIGKYFTVMDGNWVWTYIPQFQEPTRTSTFSFRLGRAFPFGQNAEQNIALWVGGMRVRFGKETSGTIYLEDLLGEEAWAQRDAFVAEYEDWYNDLGPIRNPVQYALATQYLNPIVEKIAAADGSAEIQYQLSKRPTAEWNLIVGGQYQLNKHWQLRVEGGVIGDRSSVLVSTNYRFGIRGSNKLYAKMQ